MAKHLVDLEEAKRLIEKPCKEIPHESIVALKEVNKVLRYEFSHYSISNFRWESEDKKAGINIPNFVIGDDIKNEEYKLNDIRRIHAGYIDKDLLNDFIGKDTLETNVNGSIMVNNSDLLAKRLGEYRKTKWRAFLVKSDPYFMVYCVVAGSNGLELNILPMIILTNPVLDITEDIYSQLGKSQDSINYSIRYIFDALRVLSKGTESEDLIMYAKNNNLIIGPAGNSVSLFKEGGDEIRDIDLFQRKIDVVSSLNEKSMFEFSFTKDGVNATAPLSVDMLSKNPKSERDFVSIHVLSSANNNVSFPLVYTEGIDILSKNKYEDNFDLILLSVIAVITDKES